MRLILSLSTLSILIFSLGCKTTTQDQFSLSSSEIQKEESQEKPQSIVIPVSSLGDVSETRQQILQNSLEDELKEHFTLISFEEAQQKAFEQLDYEECTEDQCIMLIQEMLQVENVFHLQVIGEGSNTQLSLSWRTLDENKKETNSCMDCGTFELDKMIGGLVGELVGKQTEIIIQKDIDGKEKKIEKKISLIDNKNRGGGVCVTVCEGLIGYYPFNGNANDISGNNNHGIVYGAKITYNHKNVKESAYYFNGENSFITIPSININSSITFSISFKVSSYPDETGDNHPMFAIVWDMDPSDTWIGMKYNGNKKGNNNIHFAWNSADSVSSAYYTKHINDKDYHLIGIYNKEKRISEIYINGEKKSAAKLKNSQTIKFNGIKIGIRDENDLMRPAALHGVIDEIRVYDRVLNTDEINLLYKNSEI